MEDPGVIVDLRKLNRDHSSKFAGFWEKMKVFPQLYMNGDMEKQLTWQKQFRDLIYQISQM